jgi:hypothetical protein
MEVDLRIATAPASLPRLSRTMDSSPSSSTSAKTTSVVEKKFTVHFIFFSINKMLVCGFVSKGRKILFRSLYLGPVIQLYISLISLSVVYHCMGFKVLDLHSDLVTMGQSAPDCPTAWLCLERKAGEIPEN